MREIENKFEKFLDAHIEYLKDIYDYPKELEGAELLLFNLDNGGYHGSMEVIFRKDGKLYEHYDSHCSCYGFEDWGAEETSIEALDKAKPYDDAFAKKLKELVIVLKEEAEHAGD